jgi:hypothetical protein
VNVVDKRNALAKVLGRKAEASVVMIGAGISFVQRTWLSIHYAPIAWQWESQFLP